MNAGVKTTPSFSKGGPKFRFSGSDYSQTISIETANEMINSYLTSIDYENSPYGLRSFVFDADTLRSYLSDTTHGKIVTLKFMLAHQEGYINEGNYGVDAGLDGRAMTFVIVGLDEDDQYIYTRDNEVYDRIKPCPAYCDNSGVNLTPLNGF